ncbi:MAG: enoyl-CoA hydratase/isomerase family protein [Burkholderiales bacterium]|nr:enoyl-CoA hydratase/isomerase family protein [Burkholderiales bacterium]
MSTELTTLALTRQGGVLHVTLNRPEQRNAMSLAMVAELRRVLAEAEVDGQTRVLVLRGAGGHFCAGGDIKDMAMARMKPAVDGQDPIAAVSTAFGELCVAFAATPLAVVAVLEGTVMGGGFGLACVADVAIASDTVAFRLPETSLGVVPAQIAPFLVERLGYSEAKRLSVCGSRLDASEALTIRLVHEVHNPGQLDRAVERVVGDILRCAPGAIAATKALLSKTRFVAAAALVPEAAAVFSRAVLGPEGVEGTTAFVQKRSPGWAPQ